MVTRQRWQAQRAVHPHRQTQNEHTDPWTVTDNAAAAPASRPSNISGVSAHIAANIPPPSPMNMNGDWSDNWDLFRAEFEDYALVMGLAEKTMEVQAATLRSVMGPECRHVYRHNLNLTAAQQGDVKTILESLDAYFKPAKNVIYERYVFGCCKQEEGESIDNFVTRLREKAATCDYGGLKDEMIRDKRIISSAGYYKWRYQTQTAKWKKINTAHSYRDVSHSRTDRYTYESDGCSKHAFSWNGSRCC